MMKDCIDHNYAGRPSGYAQVTIEGVTAEAHRRAWATANNMSLTAIKGAVVLHTCDNPRCINPEHLRLGSQAENMQDMVTKKRSLTGAKNHQAKLTEGNVRLMRELWAQRTFTIKQLAAKFNCGASQAHRIVTRQSWGDLK